MKITGAKYREFREANKTIMLVEDGLPKSDSFDSQRCMVMDAIQRNIRAGIDMDLDDDGARDVNDYAWCQDMYPDKVVYSMNGRLFQCDYTINASDVVTLGSPVEVEMSYTPVASETAESYRFMGIESTRLTEAYDATTGLLSLTVIQPGFNKSKERYYPANVLKRDHSIFEGAKMFADHQTDKDARERPEGSVHNWVGTLKKVWAESDGTVKGQAVVIDPAFKAKLDELNKQGMLRDMGVSIRAIGEASKGKIDGVDTNCVESLLRARSVDFVTYAGAGGQVETMESEQSKENDLDLVSEAEFRTRRPDLVELIEATSKGELANMKTLEQQLQEANTENAALKTKVAESEKASKKAVASAELTKLLSESKLPEIAQKKLRERFAEAVVIDGMKEAIELEREYIKSVGGTAQVKNMGEKENGTEESASDGKKPNLVEAFKLLGMNEKEAAIAAAGR